MRNGRRSILAAMAIGAFAAAPLAPVTATAVPGSGSVVFINEIHYDNAGTDEGEAIEIAGPAGTDLSGWSLVLYNGATGAAYNTRGLSGVLPDQSDGYGVLAFHYPVNGIQNGAPDGIALVNGPDLVQFLSYEGVFTAVGGPADGETSTDVGVAQSGSDPVGSSLQLTGVGTTYGHFAWSQTTQHTFGTVNTGQSFGSGEPEPEPEPECGRSATAIHDIQGTGVTFDPAFGGEQTVEAVVTAVKPGLRGFYLQEEASDADADPRTSEGIFVFTGSTPDVEVGTTVRVTGTVGEFAGSGSQQTQLTRPDIEVCGPAAEPIAPTEINFPVTSPGDFEAYEGMLVAFPQSLVISEYFNYDRFGEVVAALPLAGQDRLHTPTAVVEPGAPAQALAAEYARRRITIDDSSSAQNPQVTLHPGNGDPFTLDNRFRGGDTVTGLVGVIDHTFGLYRVHPTAYGDYAAVNLRPEDPPEVGGSLRVASFNVLNYFLTLDQDDNLCGPEKELECRGADTAEEFDRQRAKIVDAIARLDADIVGLIEMENTPGVDPAADLVAGLNDLLGAEVYASVDTGVIGTDAIRLGFIYQQETVRPAGDFAVLDSSVDPRFRDQLNRPALVQTFDEVATGARLTVTVNHLKSKGSPCDAVGDPDLGDGQGNCNVTRTLAAEALADFLATDPTGSGDPDHLVIGDLNSYDHEDPITALRDAGFVDEVKRFGGELAYSYAFDGQVGYLDHALGNSTLTGQVTGSAPWHINADEPDLIDYDMSFKSHGQDAIYAPDAFRSSDHDPVLVGLDLTPVTPEACHVDGAQTVWSYDPGNRRNGTALPPAFSDSEQALGLSDPDDDDPYWVSLGVGGEIVISFDHAVQNNNGNAADLRIVDVVDEAKGGGDAAEVFASFDGRTWTKVGEVTGSAEIDLGPLAAAHLVKIVDATEDGLPSADGYDLDAVEVLTGCEG